MPKLRYETGIATLIQFTALAFLNFVYNIGNGIRVCSKEGGCVSTLLTDLLYVLLLAMWFGIVWIIGYAAQDRRDKNLAKVLVGAEILIAGVAFINARHHPDPFGLIISLLDIGLAVWVIILAIRLIRADGGRITRATRRHRT